MWTLLACFGPSPADWPLAVALPPGWEQRSAEPSADHRREVWVSGGCRLEIDGWSPVPPSPGGPLVVASTRDVVLAGGETTTLVITSRYEGREERAEVWFPIAPDWQGRVAFRGDCPPVLVDGAMAGIRTTR